MFAAEIMATMLTANSFAGAADFGDASGIALTLSLGLLVASFFLVLSVKPAERRGPRLVATRPAWQH